MNTENELSSQHPSGRGASSPRLAAALAAGVLLAAGYTLVASVQLAPAALVADRQEASDAGGRSLYAQKPATIGDRKPAPGAPLQKVPSKDALANRGDQASDGFVATEPRLQMPAPTATVDDTLADQDVTLYAPAAPGEPAALASADKEVFEESVLEGDAAFHQPSQPLPSTMAPKGNGGGKAKKQDGLPGAKRELQRQLGPGRTAGTPAPLAESLERNEIARAAPAAPVRESPSTGLSGAITAPAPSAAPVEPEPPMEPAPVLAPEPVSAVGGVASAPARVLDEAAQEPVAEPAPTARDEAKQARGKSTAEEEVARAIERSSNVLRQHGAFRGSVPVGENPRQVAERFLAQQQTLQGLTFQSATGYWANTYVPGDPAVRLLEARLRRWQGTGLVQASLEASARQNWQPFDPPENAALATYLHADKAAIEGSSRLRLQVGLQATERLSGLRPAMNVGLVLDMRRPLDEATGARLRALVMALARARQPGDRFTLTVAGHPGGLLVKPESFRHGPLSIAMQSLFTGDRETRAPAMDLLAALSTAAESVRAGDDANAPLGASLVLLASTAPFDGQRESLERLAHENAVAGIGLSVVAVGEGVNLAHIDRLVLLGQGHRRVLDGPEMAARVVDHELHASSRAVARAVRLRIRLAPGVKLIHVLGSRNLSEPAAQRVREAERSIDRRMARNLGIRADRGEDEEGIQMVIPSFFAGDSHVILLDVLADGPGPVADVSVRYKDLVKRRNGVARARLTVPAGQHAPGPLERNVLKNQLAHVLSETAARASRHLAEGYPQDAASELDHMRRLLEGMRLTIPGWETDGELLNDETMLAEYLSVLTTSYAGGGSGRRHLSDSLRYLAHRRLLGRFE